MHWASLLLDGVLEGKKTRAVRELVVGGSRLGITTLVKELEVARIDGESLISVGADKITVGDVVGPGGTTVGLARERSALRSSVRSPATTEVGGGEGAEVATAGTLGLNNHEVLVLTLEGVDLDGLEQVVGGVAHDNGGSSSEVAGERANGHLTAVDLTIVTGEEQVHVLAVTDNGLVNGSGGRSGDLAREQRLRSRPAVSIAGVLRSAVRESGRSPLVSKDPDILGSEVEESRGNSGRGHGVLRSRGHLGPVAEETEVHGTVVAVVMVRGVDKVLAVEEGGGEILDGDPSALGLSKSSGGGPLRLSGKVASLSRNRAEKHGGRHQAGLSNGELHLEELVKKIVSE